MAEKEIVQTIVVPPLPTTVRGQNLHIDGTLKKEPRILYCNEANVIQRNLENINEARINTEHAVRVRTAKFSPNGEWICSGDESGQVVIFAHKSFVVKNSIMVGKQVLDIAWSADGQRIVAVGHGKDEKGKVFPWNSNNKLGVLGGATKGFLTCDFKPNRPFKVIAGSEDFGSYFYKGPPFVIESVNKDHTNYVQCMRFSPDGSVFVTVSSDKSIIAYDGKTNKKIKVIADGKNKKTDHKGSIYSMCWSPSGEYFITSSADKTCKVWKYESGELVHTFRFADKPSIDDMQVSCLWLEKYLISISLSGRINYLDLEFKSERPLNIITGHKKAIFDVDYSAKYNAVFSGDADCRLIRTECKSGECVDIVGDSHKCAQMAAVRVASDSSAIYSIGVNDTLCKSLIGDDEKSNIMGAKTIKLDGAVRGFCVGAIDTKLLVIATHKNKVIIVRDFDANSLQDIALKYSPTCAALSSDDKLLAVGSGRDGDNAVYFYDITGAKQLEFTITNKQYIRADIIHVAINKEGTHLATAHKDNSIWIWSLEAVKKGDSDLKPLNFNKGMKYHNGLISSIQWSPDGKQLLTAGHDSNIFIFTNPTQGKNTNIQLQHAFVGACRKAIWLSQDRIVAIGGDATIRFFDVKPVAK